MPGNQQRHTGSVVNLNVADFTRQNLLQWDGAKIAVSPRFSLYAKLS